MGLESTLFLSLPVSVCLSICICLFVCLCLGHCHHQMISFQKVLEHHIVEISWAVTNAGRTNNRTREWTLGDWVSQYEIHPRKSFLMQELRCTWRVAPLGVRGAGQSEPRGEKTAFVILTISPSQLLVFTFSPSSAFHQISALLLALFTPLWVCLQLFSIDRWFRPVQHRLVLGVCKHKLQVSLMPAANNWMFTASIFKEHQQVWIHSNFKRSLWKNIDLILVPDFHCWRKKHFSKNLTNGKFFNFPMTALWAALTLIHYKGRVQKA